MTDILKPGTHVIAGVSGNQMAPISRELIFDALVSPRRPTIIVLTDTPQDDSINRHFSIWAKARARSFTKQQLVRTDAIHSARDDDQFFRLIDRAWQLRPSPSPIFYRDTSGLPFKRDRWFGFAQELASMYRAAVLTVCNLGPHTLAAMPIKDVPGEQHYEATDFGAQVRLKHVETGEAIQFTPKNVHGGQVWNIEKETSDAA
jgi:hypothetical protein